MATAADLRMFYPSKYLSADNDPITEQTADAGGSSTTIVDSALTQADDYWNGAVGIFEPDTTTASLQGQVFHVKDFTASTDTLLLYKELPDAPVAGDTYRLILGGKWRSSTEIPGLSSSTLTNISGVTIDHVGYENGTGNGTLAFDVGDGTLIWTAPGDAAGASVDVNDSDAVFRIFSDDASKWIEITVDFSELPSGDEMDTVVLTQPVGILIPDAEGTETVAGKIRYYAIPVKNVHATDSMFDAFAYLMKEVSTAADTTTTTIAPDGGGAYPATLGLTSLTNWPDSGWVYNVDKDDFRYFYNKSGNNVRIVDPGAGVRGKTSAAWEIGDDVQLAPDIDIGLGAADSIDEFEDPATETTAPSGVAFTCPITAATGLSMGDLSATEVGIVWVRETIVAGTRAKTTALSQVRFQVDI